MRYFIKKTGGNQVNINSACCATRNTVYLNMILSFKHKGNENGNAHIVNYEDYH